MCALPVDDRLVICRCQEVTEAEIRRAIGEGARDVTGVKLRTRAATGLCQGCICQPLIERLLRRLLGLQPQQVLSQTCRPPARPLNLSVLADAAGERAP